MMVQFGVGWKSGQPDPNDPVLADPCKRDDLPPNWEQREIEVLRRRRAQRRRVRLQEQRRRRRRERLDGCVNVVVRGANGCGADGHGNDDGSAAVAVIDVGRGADRTPARACATPSWSGELPPADVNDSSPKPLSLWCEIKCGPACALLSRGHPRCDGEGCAPALRRCDTRQQSG